MESWRIHRSFITFLGEGGREGRKKRRRREERKEGRKEEGDGGREEEKLWRGWKGPWLAGG